MSKTAADFEFVLFTDVDGDSEVLVLIGPKDDPFFDQHISDQIEAFWPEGITIDEVEEGTFLIDEELTEQEVKDELINAGFVHSEEWQKELDERLGEE